MNKEGIILLSACGLVASTVAAVSAHAFGWRRLGSKIFDGLDIAAFLTEGFLECVLDVVIALAAMVFTVVVMVFTPPAMVVVSIWNFGRHAGRQSARFAKWFFTSPDPVPVPPLPFWRAFVKLWRHSCFEKDPLTRISTLPPYSDIQNPPQTIAAAMNKTGEVVNDGKHWHKNGQLHREDGPAIEYANGDKYWHKNGKLHRENGPACEFANGDKMWCLNGEYHRKDGPAVECANGDRIWRLNGQLHREDGPACEFANGSKEWWLNGKIVPEFKSQNGDKFWFNAGGKLHRENGPAVERANGDKRWYRNGQLHRENGPAIESANGDKSWYRNGELHREDGPAIECANGDKLWYKNGLFVKCDPTEKRWHAPASNEVTCMPIPQTVVDEPINDDRKETLDLATKICPREVSEEINVQELKWIALQYVPTNSWSFKAKEDSHSMWESLLEAAKRISTKTSDINLVVAHWMPSALRESAYYNSISGVGLSAYEMMRHCIVIESDFITQGKGCLSTKKKEVVQEYRAAMDEEKELRQQNKDMTHGKDASDNEGAPVDGQVLQSQGT